MHQDPYAKPCEPTQTGNHSPERRSEQGLHTNTLPLERCVLLCAGVSPKHVVQRHLRIHHARIHAAHLLVITLHRLQALPKLLEMRCEVGFRGINQRDIHCFALPPANVVRPVARDPTLWTF